LPMKTLKLTSIILITTSLQASIVEKSARTISDEIEAKSSNETDPAKKEQIAAQEIEKLGIDKDSELAKKVQENVQSTDANSWLDSVGFAFGIGSERYKTPYVQSASLNGPNKIVTIDEENDQVTSAWLTTGFNCTEYLNVKKLPFGVGPYVGIKLVGSDASTFDSISIGGQLFFIRDRATRKSINIGFGWVSHKTKTLARGIKEGEPLPAEYDEIKFQKRSEGSWMLMISSSF
jgi:hypothetical protein